MNNNMNNIRTYMGTDYTVIVVSITRGDEVDYCSGSLCNPGAVKDLAHILEKWADNTEVIIDLSID